MMIRVLQTNLGRSRAAHDLADATAVRKQNNNWLSDRNFDVAIKIRNRHMGIKYHTKGNKGWIRIKIMTEVKTREREAIIMGDINAKSYQWGSATTDVRGEYWTRWMAEINSIVQNEETTLTFIRGESKSYIDVTCATMKIAKDIKSWKVLDDEGEILTYHQYIYFEIRKTTNPGRREVVIRNMSLLNQEMFIKKLKTYQQQVWANGDSKKDPQEVNK